MNASTVVNNMLSSMSSTASVDKYLQVFGVVNDFTAMPLVFDKKYAAQWSAFLIDRKYQTKDAKLRALYTILDFVRFMRSQRLNPFVTIKGKTLNAVIRPVDMKNDLLKEEITTINTAIFNYLRKAFLSYFTIDRRIVQLSLDRKYVNINFALKPTKAAPLAQLVNSYIVGPILKINKLPNQLKPSPSRFQGIISVLSTNTTDWLAVTSILNFKLYIRIARDCLVVRAVVPVNLDHISSVTDYPRLVSLWKTVK
jgi:hypothetical protein